MVRDHIAVHKEETVSNNFAWEKPETSHRRAARKLFARNGITDPLKFFDVFEMYDPSAGGSRMDPGLFPAGR
jgi:hypothetical protein